MGNLCLNNPVFFCNAGTNVITSNTSSEEFHCNMTTRTTGWGFTHITCTCRYCCYRRHNRGNNNKTLELIRSCTILMVNRSRPAYWLPTATLHSTRLSYKSNFPKLEWFNFDTDMTGSDGTNSKGRVFFSVNRERESFEFNTELAIEHFHVTSLPPCWRAKTTIFAPLGNKIYFHAKLFHCFTPPTWLPSMSQRGLKQGCSNYIYRPVLFIVPYRLLIRFVSSTSHIYMWNWSLQ